MAGKRNNQSPARLRHHQHSSHAFTLSPIVAGRSITMQAPSRAKACAYHCAAVEGKMDAGVWGRIGPHQARVPVHKLLQARRGMDRIACIQGNAHVLVGLGRPSLVCVIHSVLQGVDWYRIKMARHTSRASIGRTSKRPTPHPRRR
jgi:hypothetical protein